MAIDYGVPLPVLASESSFEQKAYKDCLAYLHNFQSAPRPKAWQDEFQWEMANAHCLFIDLLMRVYAYAEWAVKNDDLPNYLGFAEVAFAQLWHHHHWEEEELFPYVESKIPNHNNVLNKNVEEHHIFAKPLDAAWLYVRRLRALIPNIPPSPVPEPPAEVTEIDPKDYGLDISKGFDPKALRAEMDKWLIPAVQHLTDEIATVGPELVSGMNKKEYDICKKEVQKHLQSFDPTWFLCSTVGSLPRQAGLNLMQLPLILRKGLIPLVWSRKHWPLWKYLAHPEYLTFRGAP